MTVKLLVGIIPQYEQQTLLIQRSLNAKYLPGQWTFVCGHVEGIEQIESEVLRELKEEVSLTGYVLGSIGINEWIWHEKCIRHLQVNYVVNVHNINVSLDKNCNDFKWVDRDEVLGANLLDKYNIQMYNQYIKSSYLNF